MILEVDIDRTTPTTPIVKLSGRMTLGMRLREIESRIDEAAEIRRRKLILTSPAWTTRDSAGLGAHHDSLWQDEERGRPTADRRPQRIMLDLFKKTCIDSILTVDPDLATALRHKEAAVARLVQSDGRQGGSATYSRPPRCFWPLPPSPLAEHPRRRAVGPQLPARHQRPHRLGQLPYRDFPFAHAPLTFLLHAAIIRIFGRVYFPHIVCGAIEAGIATVLSWRILLDLLDRWRNACGCSAHCSPRRLIFLGIYSIYPHPIYDSDCVLAVLVAIFLLLRAGEGSTWSFLAGAACVLPLFRKQNIGLPFLAATLLAVAIVAVARGMQQRSIAPQLWFFAGVIAALAGVLLTHPLHRRPAQLRCYWTITLRRAAPSAWPRPDARNVPASPRCCGPSLRRSPGSYFCASRGCARAAGCGQSPILLAGGAVPVDHRHLALTAMPTTAPTNCCPSGRTCWSSRPCLRSPICGLAI